MSEIIQTGADGMDGRIDRLSIKADRSGIAVYIPECMSVQDICSELYKKILRNIRAFEKCGSVYVAFKGTSLSHDETEEILQFLNDIDMVNVSFIIKTDDIQYKKDKREADLVSVKQMCPDKHYIPYPVDVQSIEKPYIFRGDLGRKQTLEIKGNVIILGDVSKDAKVISGKSIIVVGELAGIAVAGRISSERSFIMAMHMIPRMIQIGQSRIFSPKIKGDSASPMIAANDGNTINITYI